MLIRFTVENFLSFKDEMELSMVPGKTRKHRDHIMTDGNGQTSKALRSAVIYGANASGKSNLVKAIDFAKRTITRGKRPKRAFAVKPYRLDPAFADKPSKFQFEFRYKSTTYIYGFTLDSKRVHEEWLYEISTTKEKPIYERKTNSDDETVVEFSNIKFETQEERAFFNFVAKGTRSNQLFLTESMERNIRYFENIYDWFDKVLVILFPDSHRVNLEHEFIMDEGSYSEAIKNFLRDFDTGISNIDVSAVDLDTETSIPRNLKQKVKSRLLAGGDEERVAKIRSNNGRNFLVFKNDDNKITAFKLMTGHKVKGKDEELFLNIFEESDGTQRLFDLIPALFDLLHEDRVFIIDELDRSLHPHLSYKIVQLFLESACECNSQLIVTTHESSLLDQDLLRRDEIWFVEKNLDGESSLYSLEEFTPRYDNDIRKGYLLGRFGGIPFIKNVHNLHVAK